MPKRAIPAARKKAAKRESTKREAVSTRKGADDSPPAPTIVGIGASAGGLDAFIRLIQHVPAHTGLAYVLVQHLAARHESMLPQLLGRVAHIRVEQAADSMRIEADHAYVIPPNKTMTVTDGHLRLVARSKARKPHLSVDTFLCSLAEVHGPRAVGVILSGAGSDGASGIEAIKQAGGITMAQDSASAAYSSMPDAAVATGAVDFVLTPEEIAEQLGRLGQHVARHEVAPEESDAPAADSERDLREILALLHRRTGVDFQHYRRGTIHRRVLRRMLVHRQDTHEGYLSHLRLNPEELDHLYEDLLIGVTSFFRDPEVFDTLKAKGFPEIMEGHNPETPVRMWVAGCSGGEEAYSLAISMLEFLQGSAPSVSLQVFGTDLNERAIARARAGLYSDGIAEHVSPERLHRFFIREESGYRIARAVRDCCVFSRQNVVRDPPFSHLDLISCRNVLIYLAPILQQRVFPIFHYALEPHGLLLLGNAESVGSAGQYFSPLEKRQRIFQRVSGKRHALDVDFVTPTTRQSGEGQARHSTLRAHPIALPDELEREADHVVLARYAPPGVVVNEQLEIVRFRGNTGPYLTHTSGAATLSVLSLARPELMMPLRLALRRANSEDVATLEEHVSVGEGDASHQVTIEVLPFLSPSTSARYFAVLFREDLTTRAGRKATKTTSAKDGGSSTRNSTRELRAAHEEIEATKRYLQDIVEQYEATHEELRAASEEIQSSNEELQSTNEELETTKEEVQSTNEELSTLNDELRQRNSELSALSGDLANVLASTTIPIVIVGRDLRIRRFTPAAERVMRVIASDAGRPISDIKLRVALPDLEALISSAAERLAITEREVRDDNGQWWAFTVRPYQTADRHVEGAVLVFTDIDASKRFGERTEEIVAAREQMLLVAEEARTTADHARNIAEAANSAKTTFLASMSHDLRTPLNAIAGYTELLEMGIRGPVTDEQLADFRRIKRSARHLLSLINDILNFAKVESGKLEFRLSNVEVADVAHEMEELVAPQLAAKSIRFERDGADGVVHADPEKLRQILLNLFSNALKFTDSGGRVGVRAGTDANQVRIEIWDTGMGIAAEQQERIFEPFVQVGRGLTTPAHGGVGLGLAISRDLARAMGGDLTVASVVGEGSTFTVTLPRADAES